MIETVLVQHRYNLIYVRSLKSILGAIIQRVYDPAGRHLLRLCHADRINR